MKTVPHDYLSSVQPLVEEKGISLLLRIRQCTTIATLAHVFPSGYRPIVGVPLLHLAAGNHPQAVVDWQLLQAIQAAGGTPLPFFCRPLSRRENPFVALWRQLVLFDALVILGGAGVPEPHWYDQERHPQTRAHPQPWQDWWIFHMTVLATIVRLPVLAVGEGCEYYNIALGGTNYQHLPTERRGSLKHCVRRKASFAVNPVRVLDEGIFANCAHDESEIVALCSHSGGIKMLAPGLIETGVALDGLCEVVERADDAFGIGVQFRPERSTDAYARRLFEHFIEAGKRYAARDRPALEDMMDDIAWYVSHSQTVPRLVLPAHAQQEQQAGLSRNGTARLQRKEEREPPQLQQSELPAYASN